MQHENEPIGDAIDAAPTLELQPLAALADGSDPIAARKVLLANLDQLARAALARRCVEARRNGVLLEVPDPDLHNAIKSQELAARILGASVDKLELAESQKVAMEKASLTELFADATKSPEVQAVLAELGWTPPPQVRQ